MPKQTETSDRFRIIAEVDALRLGPMLAQLARMGVDKLDYELVTDVITFKNNNTPRGETEKAIREWIADHPTFHLAALREGLPHLPATTIHGAARRLVDKGVLVALGDGNYRRADVAALKAPAVTPPAAPAAREKKERAIDLLRRFTATHPAFTTKEAKAFFAEQGRKDQVHPVIYQLVQKREIRRIGEVGGGRYEVPQAKRNAKLNGASAHA